MEGSEAGISLEGGVNLKRDPDHPQKQAFRLGSKGQSDFLWIRAIGRGKGQFLAVGTGSGKKRYLDEKKKRARG